jgi:hypothetical protein
MGVLGGLLSATAYAYAQSSRQIAAQDINTALAPTGFTINGGGSGTICQTNSYNLAVGAYQLSSSATPSPGGSGQGAVCAMAVEMLQPATYVGGSVALYAAATGSNSNANANVWAFNPLIAAQSGAGGDYQCIEVDVNDYSGGSATTKGISITGIGTSNPTVGVEIVRTQGNWKRGLHLLNTIKGIEIENDASALTNGLIVGGVAVSGTTVLCGQQLVNGDDTIFLQRQTDSSPSGFYLRGANAANNTSLWYVDANGACNFTTLRWSGSTMRQPIPQTTFYVNASTGNDSNNGLSSGTAWQTIGHAYSAIVTAYDFTNQAVTIQCADSASYASFVIGQPWTGGGAITIQGNTGTPANCVITGTSADAIGCSAVLPANLTIKGFKVTTSTSGCGINHYGSGGILIANMEFGVIANAAVQVAQNCFIGAVGNTFKISGGMAQFFNALHGGFIQYDSVTTTITGTPAFTSAFAQVANTGKIEAVSNTFSGSATGTRYSANTNGVINTSGGGANYFPGNAVGTTVNGGIYV